MKRFMINVNGKAYDVEVQELTEGVSVAPVVSAPVVSAPVAAPKAATPAPAANVAGTKVTAPMPGTILKINVTVGADVKEGDAVAVLEAMKMENDIPAPTSGKVVAINAKQGDTVESGDAIIVIG